MRRSFGSIGLRQTRHLRSRTAAGLRCQSIPFAPQDKDALLTGISPGASVLGRRAPTSSGTGDLVSAGEPSRCARQRGAELIQARWWTDRIHSMPGALSS